MNFQLVCPAHVAFITKVYETLEYPKMTSYLPHGID